MIDEYRQATESAASRKDMERRGATRIVGQFPAVARGVDINGVPFDEHVVIENLSANGLYVWLPQPIETGAWLFVVVRFTLGEVAIAPVPGVAVRGVVLRADQQNDGRCGAAVMFVRHRFLFAK